MMSYYNRSRRNNSASEGYPPPSRMNQGQGGGGYSYPPPNYSHPPPQQQQPQSGYLYHHAPPPQANFQEMIRGPGVQHSDSTTKYQFLPYGQPMPPQPPSYNQLSGPPPRPPPYGPSNQQGYDYSSVYAQGGAGAQGVTGIGFYPPQPQAHSYHHQPPPNYGVQMQRPCPVPAPVPPPVPAVPQNPPSKDVKSSVVSSKYEKMEDSSTSRYRDLEDSSSRHYTKSADKERIQNKRKEDRGKEPSPPNLSDLKPEMKKSVPIMVGKRRGGRTLPTGVVKKQKQDSPEEGKRTDAWSQYMNEVKRYKDRSCEDDRKNRPLVK